MAGESGPRELPHRATGCDNATTIYDSNEEQCVVSYARSAQTCISGAHIDTTATERSVVTYLANMSSFVQAH